MRKVLAALLLLSLLATPPVSALPTLMEANIAAVANEIATGQDPSGRCGT